MAERLFTLPEARASLEKLREILPRLMEARREAEPLQASLAEVLKLSAGNGHVVEDDVAAERQRLERLASLISTAVNEFANQGIEIKDLERGLVDFRSEMFGRVVYLCWVYGEEDIEWWHELDTGFSGRQRLPQDAPGS